MRFATKESFASTEGVETASPVITLPSGIVSGDLLIVVLGVRANTVGKISGWTSFANSAATLTDQRSFWRKADGGEGATVTASLSTSTINWTAIAYRYSGAADPDIQPPEGATAFLDVDDVNPDSPNLTPTGGGKDYVWISTFFHRINGLPTVFPDNYVNTGSIQGPAANPNATGYCDRELNAASENPSAFTAQSADWSATTIAIHPALEVHPYPIKRIPWTEQPPEGVQLDLSNPLTRGLINVWVFNKGAGVPDNLIAGGLTLENGDGAGSDEMSWAQDADGIHMHSAAVADRVQTSVQVDADTAWPQGTIIMGLKPTTLLAATSYRYFGSDDNFEGRIDDNANSPFQADLLGNGNPGGANLVAVDTLFKIGHSWTPVAADIYVRNFFNGAFIYDHTDLRLATVNRRLAIMARRDALVDGFIGNVYFFYQFDRVLTDDEHQALGENPWQIFQSQRQPLLIEQPALAPHALPIRPVPWAEQPPQEVPLDRSNFFGQHCVAMIIPGWSAASQDDSVVRTNQVPMIGTPFTFDTDEVGTVTSGSIFTQQVDFRGRSAVVMTQDSIGATRFDGYRLHAEASEGPLWGLEQFSVIAIYKPSGDGSAGAGSDPRIFTKDITSATLDHDVMVGMKASGAQVNTVPRTRVRIGSDVLTVLPADTAANAIQNDSWNLVASTVRANEVKIHGLREDGGYATATDTGTGVYSPRSTTEMACFGTAGVPENQFIGQLLGVWFFDVSLDTEELLSNFFDNPWQVFEPQRQPLLMEQFEIVLALDHAYPIREVPWTEQPPPGTALNYQHPVMADAVFLRTGDRINLINGKEPDTIGSSTPYVQTEMGLAVDCGNADPDEYADDGFDGADRVTCYALVKFNSLTTGNNENRLIFRPISGSTHSESDFTLDVGDIHDVGVSRVLGVADTGADADDLAEGNTDLVIDTWYCLALRWVSGREIQCFVNGALDGTSLNTRTYTMASAGSIKEIWVGGRSGATDDVDGEIAFVAAFRGYHSLDQIASISANPWQLFEPRYQPLLMTSEDEEAATVVITDVNTTESWDDGDTGLIATGTGFV